jgi:hypothetical protein
LWRDTVRTELKYLSTSIPRQNAENLSWCEHAGMTEELKRHRNVLGNPLTKTERFEIKFKFIDRAGWREIPADGHLTDSPAGIHDHGSGWHGAY